MKLLEFLAISEEPAVPVSHELSDQDVVDYSTGVLPVRRNYTHLRTVISSGQRYGFSSQSSFVDTTRNYKTDYILSIPLPVAWLDDVSLHWKAHALETLLAAQAGFEMEFPSGSWKVIDIKSDRWLASSCLCEKCHYVKEECKCQVCLE